MEKQFFKQDEFVHFFYLKIYNENDFLFNSKRLNHKKMTNKTPDTYLVNKAEAQIVIKKLLMYLGNNRNLRCTSPFFREYKGVSPEILNDSIELILETF